MLVEVDYIALGRRISQCRHTRGLTQEALAERAGISAKFVGNIERGVGTPSVNTIVSLSAALDCSLDDLLTPSVARRVDDDAPHALRDQDSIFCRTLTDLLLDASSEESIALLEIGPEYDLHLPA